MLTFRTKFKLKFSNKTFNVLNDKLFFFSNIAKVYNLPPIQLIFKCFYKVCHPHLQ